MFSFHFLEIKFRLEGEQALISVEKQIENISSTKLCLKLDKTKKHLKRQPNEKQ